MNGREWGRISALVLEILANIAAQPEPTQGEKPFSRSSVNRPRLMDAGIKLAEIEDVRRGNLYTGLERRTGRGKLFAGRSTKRLAGTLIEPWWKQSRSLALQGKCFENLDELTSALSQGLDYWNADQRENH